MTQDPQGKDFFARAAKKHLNPETSDKVIKVAVHSMKRRRMGHQQITPDLFGPLSEPLRWAAGDDLGPYFTFLDDVATAGGDSLLHFAQGVAEFGGEIMPEAKAGLDVIKDAFGAKGRRVDMIDLATAMKSGISKVTGLEYDYEHLEDIYRQSKTQKEAHLRDTAPLSMFLKDSMSTVNELATWMHPAFPPMRVIGATGKAVQTAGGKMLGEAAKRWVIKKGAASGLTLRQAAKLHKSGQLLPWLAKHSEGMQRGGAKLATWLRNWGITPGSTVGMGLGFAAEQFLSAKGEFDPETGTFGEPEWGHRWTAAQHAALMGAVMPVFSNIGNRVQKRLLNPSVSEAEKSVLRTALTNLGAGKFRKFMANPYVARVVAAEVEALPLAALFHEGWADDVLSVMSGDLSKMDEVLKGWLPTGAAISLYKHNLPFKDSPYYRRLLPEAHTLEFEATRLALKQGKSEVPPSAADHPAAELGAAPLLRAGMRMKSSNEESVTLEFPGTKGEVRIFPEGGEGPLGERSGKPEVEVSLSLYEAVMGEVPIARGPGEGIVLSDPAPFMDAMAVHAMKMRAAAALNFSGRNYVEADPGSGIWMAPNGVDVLTVGLDGRVKKRSIFDEDGSWQDAGQILRPEGSTLPQEMLPLMTRWEDFARALSAHAPPSVNELMAVALEVARSGNPNSKAVQELRAFLFNELLPLDTLVAQTKDPLDAGALAVELGSLAAGTNSAEQAITRLATGRPAATELGSLGEYLQRTLEQGPVEPPAQEAERPQESRAEEPDVEAKLSEIAKRESWAGNKERFKALEDYIVTAMEAGRGAELTPGALAKQFSVDRRTARDRLNKYREEGEVAAGGKIVKDVARKVTETDPFQVFQQGMGALFKGQADRLRGLPTESGREIASALEEIARTEGPISSQWILQAGKVGKGLSAKERQQAGRYLDLREGDPAREKMLQEMPKKVVEFAENMRAIYDEMMQKGAEVGLKRRVGGKLKEIKGSGRAMPLSLTSAGYRYVQELRRKDEAGELRRQAEELVKRGRYADLETAVGALRQQADSMAGGGSIREARYLTRERTLEIPEKHPETGEQLLERDPLRNFESHARRVARFVAAVKEFGLPREMREEKAVEGRDFGPTLKTLLGKFKLEMAGKPGEQREIKSLESFLDREFGAGKIRRPLVEVMSNFETVTRLGIFPIGSMIMNASQPWLSNAIRLGIIPTTMGYLRTALTPSGWKEFSVALKQIKELGLADPSVAHIVQGHLGTRAMRKMMMAFGAVERGNRVMQMIISGRELEKRLRIAFRKIDKGKDAPPQIKRIRRLVDGLRDLEGHESKFTDEQIMDAIMGRGSSDLRTEMIIEAGRRGNQDQQFAMDLATSPGWYSNPYARWLGKFKPFMLKQSRFLYESTVKYGIMEGDFMPMIRLMFASAVVGEMYYLIMDHLTGEERSKTIRILSDEGDETSVYDILAHMGRGGGLGMFYDATWGLGDMIMGPAISSMATASKFAWDALANDAGMEAAKQFAREQVTTGRVMEKVAESFFYDRQLYRDYARAWNFRRIKEGDRFKDAIKTAIFGMDDRVPGDYSTKLRSARDLLFLGDREEATNRLTEVLEDIGSEYAGEDLKDKLQGVRASLNRRAPLSPTTERWRDEFIARYPKEGEGMLKRHNEYRSAVNEVIFEAKRRAGVEMPEPGILSSIKSAEIAKMAEGIVGGSQDWAGVQEEIADLAEYLLSYMDEMGEPFMRQEDVDRISGWQPSAQQAFMEARLRESLSRKVDRVREERRDQ